MCSILTPGALWKDFNPYEPAIGFTNRRNGNAEEILFDCLDAGDGTVKLAAELYRPDFASKKTVVLIRDFFNKPQKELTEAFLARGINVVVPDYCGKESETRTVFPKSLSYGYIDKGGEHLTEVCPTAEETSYYLYTKLIRRTITLAETVLGATDVVLVGFRGGAEIALQTAGVDGRVKGVALIAGAGYTEYVDYPKYDSDAKLELDEKMTAWLTGVSGTAYAKKIAVPVMIALGSNGKTSDIDRLLNLLSLMPNADARLVISVGYADNIDAESFGTVLKWLDGVFVGSLPPEIPTMSAEVNSEGKLTASIFIDDSLKAKSVKLYYALNNNDHSTRYWHKSEAEFVSGNEYLANVRTHAGDRTLFGFCRVEYVNGLVLSGVVDYRELSDLRLSSRDSVCNPIVFQYPDEGFTEVASDVVIFESTLREKTLPAGIKGVVCDESMITYAIGNKNCADPAKLLQIDTYSDKKNYKLTVSCVKTDVSSVTYTAVRDVECTDRFCSTYFTPNDFKDDYFGPMGNWENVKSLMIKEGGIVVGKIMFV